MSQIQQSIAKGISFALATALVASVSGAVSKWVSTTAPVPLIVLSQYVVCMLVLLPWLVRQPLEQLSTRRWKTHLARGIAGWLCFYTYYAALSQVPLVDASLLRNAAPIFVPLVAWLWVGTRVPAKRWLPLLLGFAGIALILQPGATSINRGHLFGLLSGLTLAGSMVGTRLLSHTDRPSLILFYYTLISLVCSLPLGIYYWQPVPLWALPYLMFNGLSVFLAMWLYTKAYSYAKPSVVSPISYFGVVLSGFIGWLIWQHLPSETALVGTLMVIGAGMLTLYLSAEDKPPATESLLRNSQRGNA